MKWRTLSLLSLGLLTTVVAVEPGLAQSREQMQVTTDWLKQHINDRNRGLLHDGDKLYEHTCKKLGITHKEVTPDGQLSIEEVECMGACSWAPAVQVNYDFHHHVTPEKLDQLLDGLRKKQ